MDQVGPVRRETILVRFPHRILRRISIGLIAASAALLIAVLTANVQRPNVILEAMTARLPVITTPAGDAGVIVEHDKTGYVVKPDDAQSMAAFIVRLAQSPSLRMKLGEAGRTRVEQEYDYESLSHRLIAIFHGFAALKRETCLRELLEHGASSDSRLARRVVSTAIATETA